MRTLRPGFCLLLVGCAIATQISLAPLLGRGPDAVDVPLLLLLWFALVDRWPRLVGIGGAIVLSRVLVGASSPVAVALPLLAAVLWVRGARTFVDPRDRGRRFAIVVGGIAVAGAVHRLAASVPWAGEVDGWATGLLLATGTSLLLYPILDLTTPLLRSADHPM